MSNYPQYPNNNRNSNNYAQNNELLRRFQAMYYNQNLVNNNAYIRNNPIYNPRMQQNMMNHAMQMNMMQHTKRMQELRKLYEIRKMQKFNDIENIYDKDAIKESVIQPIKIEKTDTDKKELDAKYSELSDIYKNYKEYLKKYWNQRENTPYKGIMNRDIKHKGKNYRQDYNKEIKKSSDLVVHKVTKMDKLGVFDDYEAFLKNLEKHNNELKIIYNLSKKAQHTKKFEYHHKYKYRIKYKPSDHKKMKKNKIDYYKKEQKKLEKDEENLDNLLNGMIKSDLWSAEQLNDYGLLGDKINIDQLEKRIETELDIKK
jgi:hypothetical protein